MGNVFGRNFYGKQGLSSQYGVCVACRKLTVLGSYTTGRFLHLREFPLIPLGKIYIVDECACCGRRGVTSSRKHRRLRKRYLTDMMDAFASDPDNPATALNGLQTLMVYNEESWFLDVAHSYGRRFETHLQVQVLIAEGLCRFGHYADAEVYCQKAIALGSAPRAEELLALCQSLREKDDSEHMTALCPQQESMLRPYAFLMIVTASCFIALVANGISAMRNHTAWLVSGSPVPYTVEIDGSRYRIGSYGLKRIKLRLGEHRMQAYGLAGCKAPVLFCYKTSLLRQKFGDHALVLNPDALAVLVEESLPEGQEANHFQFGKIISTLEGIDYPFSSFPVWAGSRSSAQTRLFNYVPTNHLEMVSFLYSHGDSADATKYARRILVIEPESEEAGKLLKIAISDLSTEQTIAFLEKGKTLLPPLPEWHCFYQNFMEVQKPSHDLQTEYALLCKEHPDMPEYYYLLGRVAQKSSTAKLCYEKSEKEGGSRGLGYHAIAYDLLCSGQFKAAQPYSQKALERSPDHEKFKETNRQVLLALRQYDDLIPELQTRLEANPENGEWFADKIKYLTLIGEHKAVSESMGNFSNPDKNWNAYFHAVRFYVTGNAEDYLEALQESGRGNARLQQLLHRGEIEAAHNLLSKNEDHDYTDHLILYCAAIHQGCPDIAEVELTKAIAEFGTSTLIQKEAAAMLSNENYPSIKQVLDLRIMPQEKAIFSTALGFKFPDQQKEYFNLSWKFNYTPEYPQLLLKKWTRKSVLAR